MDKSDKLIGQIMEAGREGDARRAALVIYPERGEDMMVSLRHCVFGAMSSLAVARLSIKPIEAEVHRIIVGSEYYQQRRRWGLIDLPWGYRIDVNNDDHITLFGFKQYCWSGGDGRTLDKLVGLIDDIDAGWLDVVKQYVGAKSERARNKIAKRPHEHEGRLWSYRAYEAAFGERHYYDTPAEYTDEFEDD